MLHASSTSVFKRRALRESLASGSTLQFPGAFNPLSALMIERNDFGGVYISGAVIAADLGLPDIGLTTLSEVAKRSVEITRVTNLPTLVDADTGFGESMNVARTVQVLEDAGVAAIHIEDQVNPKRCGHLDGKSVVNEATAMRRIQAAVSSRRDAELVIAARTDIRGIEGFQAAVDRSKALRDAGADVIFPEALQSLGEYETLRAEVGLPLIANMTEFGKTPLFSLTQLGQVGVGIIIYPVSIMRLAMGAAEKGLHALKVEGTLESQVPQMQTRADLYDLIRYESFNQFDSEIYNFDVESKSDADVDGEQT